ncbi:DNA gyrase A-subunit (nucleomorph) [Guillardia theta]|uniref:DNA topoisomerase (ATP-hydrolyzing) n=1 Tax=Guillardia theta TaxID=55529 RepID=Q98RX7_GUITH|nr:DNA gyrase A-subunit [Guillardia theta]AAK39823.1 DNA gyrase A-subunit [Guillardia theta]|mmetsp:Transcript_16968/g.56194  ORF Transcript_16968/g.56194 Transcript_16968/m.56194 type:complete len:878 (+) Transcript_16968:1819-4452(+)
MIRVQSILFNCILKKGFIFNLGENKNFVDKFNRNVKFSKFLIFSSYSSENNGSIKVKYTNDKTRIINTELQNEMAKSYMEYALSVIYGRALPDIRDGLKPVHRRILFAMYELNLVPEAPYRKCARVVGEVLGKYHPHGDTAVYDSLVRMSQEFSMRKVLILGHGNFGSIDHDPPAAMRYTECKLSNLSVDTLLKELDFKTVEYVYNFDGSSIEPSIMPSVIPSILLNGSSGIAVGMATSIPPHNLGEIVRSCLALIDNYNITNQELIKYLPCPDFPTGGLIIGNNSCKDLYEKGISSIILRGKINVEFSKSVKKVSKYNLIITEIPFQINKSMLIAKLADLVNSKIIQGISDIRDESDRKGIRIVIEIKRDYDPIKIVKIILKKSSLQITFSSYMLCIVDKQPILVNLKEILSLFLHFRRKIIRKNIKFELKNILKKKNILKGISISLEKIDLTIEKIKKSINNLEAKCILMEFGLSQEQSEAILNLQLRRLTKLESKKIDNDFEITKSSLNELKCILSSNILIDGIIKNQIKNISEIYGFPRKTLLINSINENIIEELETIENYESVIMITQYYIKKMFLESFESQTRGTKGKRGLIISDGDEISHFFSCNNRDDLIAISSGGIAYKIKVSRIPISKRNSKGTPILSILKGLENNQISSIIATSNCETEKFLVLLTQKGLIKRTSISNFNNISSRGLIILTLDENDSLKWVRKCYNDDSVIISTKKGKLLRFNASQKELKSTGRTSKGIKSIDLDSNDIISDFDIIPSQAITNFIILLTEMGYGKRIKVTELKIQKRGKKGIKVISLRENVNDYLISSRFCIENEEILISTSYGNVVKQKISDIAVQKKNSKGIIIQRLTEGDKVSKISIINSVIN